MCVSVCRKFVLEKRVRVSREAERDIIKHSDFTYLVIHPCQHAQVLVTDRRDAEGGHGLAITP